MAAAPQGNQADNSTAILWGIAAIFFTLGGIWYFGRDYIIVGYLELKLLEVKLMTLILGNRFEQMIALLNAAIGSPKAINFSDLGTVGNVVGAWLRIPCTILMIILAFVVYFSNSTRVFKRTYNMHDLAKVEKSNWPQISPPINLNLLKKNIDEGPWAMALTPMQFCKKYQLLEEVRVQRREGMSHKDRDRIEVILKRGEANRVFISQLGPMWGGVDKLPMYTKALFAVFAARLNSDTKSALALLKRMNASCTNAKMDYSGVDELCKKHEKAKLVVERVKNHAYVMTVMASMLEGAREDGVQASADFLWLKPVDRRLWYILNTVGRQTPFVEVAGIFAHWAAEKEAGKRLVMPLVEEATKALELALLEVVYHAEDN